MPDRPRRASQLVRRLLLLQLVTVLVTVGGVAGWAAWGAREIETSAAQRLTQATAQSVASDPQVVGSVGRGGDIGTVSASMQPLAERVRVATGTTFVVVMTTDGLRYSHPEPDRIGRNYVGSITEARSGGSLSEHYEGTLGRSVRTVVPVFDRGRVVGLVSVGVLENRVSALARRALPWIVTVAGLAVLVGGMLAWLLARRVRRQTLGLEPEEIAAAYTHHDAVLHAVREGLMVLDREARVVVVNAEARRLLGFGPEQQVEGLRLVDLGVDPALRALTRPATGGAEDVRDTLTLAGERVLLVSRTAAGPRAGDGTRVVTLRDRTELADVLRERDAARDRARGLSEQAHEFANRMQTVLTLVELGDTADAVRAGSAALERARGPVDAVTGAVRDLVLAASLLDKAWAATERGVRLEVIDTTTQPPPLEPDDLVSLVSNLVDNALDAAAGTPGAAVRLTLSEGNAVFEIEVADTGPGIPPDAVAEIFDHGFSTKETATARPRGIGLALVARIVRRLGGSIEVEARDPGTTFRLTLPSPVRHPGDGAGPGTQPPSRD